MKDIISEFRGYLCLEVLIAFHSDEAVEILIKEVIL